MAEDQGPAYSIDEPLSHLQSAAVAVQQLIDSLGARGALIGGFAVGMWSEARTTRDIDAVLLDDAPGLAALLDKAKQVGLVPRVPDVPGDLISMLVARLTHPASKVDVDLAIGLTEFERELVDRSVVFKLAAGSFRVANVDDLLVTKLVAHRDIDLIDARRLIEANPDVDLDRVQRFVKFFGDILDEPNLWERVQPFLHADPLAPEDPQS